MSSDLAFEHQFVRLRATVVTQRAYIAELEAAESAEVARLNALLVAQAARISQLEQALANATQRVPLRDVMAERSS
jgi:small-conductance mechanosensitive channel